MSRKVSKRKISLKDMPVFGRLPEDLDEGSDVWVVLEKWEGHGWQYEDCYATREEAVAGCSVEMCEPENPPEKCLLHMTEFVVLESWDGSHQAMPFPREVELHSLTADDGVTVFKYH